MSKTATHFVSNSDRSVLSCDQVTNLQVASCPRPKGQLKDEVVAMTLNLTSNEDQQLWPKPRKPIALALILASKTHDLDIGLVASSLDL